MKIKFFPSYLPSTKRNRENKIRFALTKQENIAELLEFVILEQLESTVRL